SLLLALEILLEPADIIIPVHDIWFHDQVAEQRDRRFHALQHEFVEGAAQPHQAFGAVAAEHDQLADEAVVAGRDGVARVDAGVDPDPEAAGRMVRLDAPRRRPEGDRVLRIDAALDGMAVELDVALFGPQFAAGGDPYLLLDEVDA